MKVVVFNGSPKMEKGDTALILKPFLEGLQSTGAEVELFYTSKLNIHPCRGEYNCWFKTPGNCFQDDDVQVIHPKLREADVWVFATPVYFWGMPGPLKTLLDRILPLGEPFITLRDDHSTHPLRADVKARKVVLVSSCGLWEMDNFDPLRMHFETVCRMLGIEFAGALLRPHGSTFGFMLQRRAPVRDVLDAARDAGYQLGSSGVMSAKTLEAVGRPLLSRDAFVQAVNNDFQRRVDAISSGS
jgi:multimeric flavodoxin WrbA